MYEYALNWHSLGIIAEKSISVKKELEGSLTVKEYPEASDLPLYNPHLVQFPRFYRFEHTEVCEDSTFQPRRGIPGLLLANKQIHMEAIGILTRKPLIFTEPVPYGSEDWGDVYGDLSGIISNELLRKVERIEVHVKKEGFSPCIHEPLSSLVVVGEVKSLWKVFGDACNTPTRGGMNSSIGS